MVFCDRQVLHRVESNTPSSGSFSWSSSRVRSSRVWNESRMPHSCPVDPLENVSSSAEFFVSFEVYWLEYNNSLKSVLKNPNPFLNTFSRRWPIIFHSFLVTKILVLSQIPTTYVPTTIISHRPLITSWCYFFTCHLYVISCPYLFYCYWQCI